MKMQRGTTKVKVRLTFKAPPGNKVYVAGSFNHWAPDETALSGPDKAGNYGVTLLLDEGHHEYLFVVNGEWQTDPMNPHCVPNVFGTWNNVVEVVRLQNN